MLDQVISFEQYNTKQQVSNILNTIIKDDIQNDINTLKMENKTISNTEKRILSDVSYKLTQQNKDELLSLLSKIKFDNGSKITSLRKQIKSIEEVTSKIKQSIVYC